MMTADNDRILEVKGVYKRYARTIPAKRRQVLRQFSRALRGQPDDIDSLASDEFWALQDISFSLNRGEALGLIGLNGAGKSTLLRIIAQQIVPDRGFLRCRGTYAAMLDLAAGLESDLTGRENIFLKGALAGRSRSEMINQFDEIVDFADIHDFLDSPISTYSTGMRMRLAFSVAVHTNPDLLMIDEVLSVGDFRFRQKCLRKLNELRKFASFVIVSHSFQDIARFCTRLIVLENAAIIFDGPPQEGLALYAKRRVKPNRYMPPNTSDNLYEDLFDAPLALMGDFFHRDESIEHASFAWFQTPTKPIDAIIQGHEIFAEISCRFIDGIEGITIGLPIWNDEGVLVTSLNSDTADFKITSDTDGRIRIRIHLDSMDLNPGIYYPVLSIVRNSEFIYRQPVTPLTVEAANALCWGIFTPRAHWVNEPNKEQNIICSAKSD